MILRLASYNVHKGLGLDRRRDPGRTLDVLAGIGATVVALQEVDHRIAPRRAALPPALVAARTGLAALPFAPHDEGLGWHGQTILYHPGLTPAHIQRIVLPGLEPRGAVLAEFASDGGGFRVVGVHLGLVRRHRLMQLAAIRAALSRRAEMPTALLGDFNEWSSRGGIEPLVGAFRVHAPGPSFPAIRPVARLDRIALGRGLHLVAAGVGEGKLARLASDHLPVWADVRLDRAAVPAG
jgi:endonuclease/exonuclease/phosphatase family metal-dependent hydrolase